MANNSELEAQGYIPYVQRPIRLCTTSIRSKPYAIPGSLRTEANTRKIYGYYSNKTYVPFLYIKPFPRWIVPKQKAINNKHFLYSPITIDVDDVKPLERTNELTDEQLTSIEDQIDSSGIAIININENQLFIATDRGNKNTGVFQL